MNSRQPNKSYAAVGAGQLLSTIWKRHDERTGWRYRFNVYRMSALNGDVSRLLRPIDVIDLVKLCQVLAATFVDDGCVPNDERQLLRELAAKLDAITNKDP